MTSNTLFNYFTKSPGINKVSSPNTLKAANSPKTPSNKRKLTNGKSKDCTPSRPSNGIEKKSGSQRKKENIVYKSDSEEEAKTPPEKRRRVFEIDSEGDASEDDFKPDEEEESSEESLSEHSESEPDSADNADDGSPVKNNKRKAPTSKKTRKKQTSSVTPVRSKGAPLLPHTPITPSANKEAGIAGEGTNWPHLKYDFLQPNRIKDNKMRPPSHPEYDPRTLYVPEDFKRTITPAMRQWWEMKSKHFDCILFFKVGKFYELYHMDAVVGASELSLLFMKGDLAHSGFPEVAYGKYSVALVERGYKVARVEQTETPDMMTERCKHMSKPTKFDKVVKREICQLTSKGTKVFSVQDGGSVNAESIYLFALTEKERDGKSVYGVCFVDTSIAMFHLGEFEDDRHCSRLRTLFAHHTPGQILFERGQLSAKTKKILDTALSSVMKEQLAPDSEFWSSSKTLTTLSERNYFENGSPDTLKKFLSDSDSLGLTASDDYDLAIRALGAITWYLSRCQLDQQLLSMGQFSLYQPVDNESPTAIIRSQGDTISGRHMILDSVTLKNLHLLENSCGGTVGTLLYKLDHCSTPMGKRLMHNWLCSPLIDIRSIEARQIAVTELIGQPQLLQEARTLMAKLPDLERLLTRIFAQSSRGQNSSHPDSRAIIFGEKTQSKKTILEFISVLNGFKNVQEVAEKFQGAEVGEVSELLRQCSHFKLSKYPGKFPDLTDHMKFFKNAFNHEEASKEGNIIPSTGVDPEYDQAVEALEELKKEQKAYLNSQCDLFKCKVVYVGSDKKRFQLEIPEGACRKVTSDYQLQGQRKGFKRYYTPESKELLDKQMKAEESKTNVLRDIRKRIFSRFCERYADWTVAVECLAVLDVLMSFAEYCRGQQGDLCIPQFVSPDSCPQPFVTLKNGSYPCTVGEELFIPNDTVIGNRDSRGPSLLLVTGPNMGGKSTLMRQLGLILVMAQMGCRVPAESLQMTPVDRIFTRLGASDDIIAGESTFYLELCETSAVMAHASKHSLVLIDELGRGTSTYDGTAIAYAVLKQLTTIQCRTLFSTHYHSLVEDFKDNDSVALGHMACMAEAKMEEAVAEDNGVPENVTFLYKFTAGACPKSYGFNAARLAGVPAHITRRGYECAKTLEAECNLRKTFQSIFRKEFDSGHVRQLINSL